MSKPEPRAWECCYVYPTGDICGRVRRYRECDYAHSPDHIKPLYDEAALDDFYHRGYGAACDHWRPSAAGIAKRLRETIGPHSLFFDAIMFGKLEALADEIEAMGGGRACHTLEHVKEKR